MWSKLSFYILLNVGFALPAGAAVDVCGFYRDVYQNEIRKKIEAGVPFELMSAIFEDSRLINKKAVRIGYNLWDEIVTVKSGEKTLARFAMSQGATEVCKYLSIDEDLKPGQRYLFRLLLNPLWGERITRLQVAAGGSDGGASNAKIMDINWKKLAGEMPSDKVLLEKEILR